MKRSILLSLMMFFAVFVQAQEPVEELQKEVAQIKSAIQQLRTDVNEVRTQNIYLKEVLDINRAVTEDTKDNISIKITDITGDSSTETVSVTLLVEATEENKRFHITELSAIDLEGNEFSIQRYKQITGLSSGGSTELTLNVPKKVIPIFVKVPAKTQMLKWIKIETFESAKYFDYEFRDLKINWK